jgi:hypothetical protein
MEKLKAITALHLSKTIGRSFSVETSVTNMSVDTSIDTSIEVIEA